MPKPFLRLVALLLVPCLVGDALLPAGAATFWRQEAALIADPAAANAVFDSSALQETLTTFHELLQRQRHPLIGHLARWLFRLATPEGPFAKRLLPNKPGRPDAAPASEVGLREQIQNTRYDALMSLNPRAHFEDSPDYPMFFSDRLMEAVSERIRNGLLAPSDLTQFFVDLMVGSWPIREFLAYPLRPIKIPADIAEGGNWLPDSLEEKPLTADQLGQRGYEVSSVVRRIQQLISKSSWDGSVFLIGSSVAGTTRDVDLMIAGAAEKKDPDGVARIKSMTREMFEGDPFFKEWEKHSESGFASLEYEIPAIEKSVIGYGRAFRIRGDQIYEISMRTPTAGASASATAAPVLKIQEPGAAAPGQDSKTPDASAAWLSQNLSLLQQAWVPRALYNVSKIVLQYPLLNGLPLNLVVRDNGRTVYLIATRRINGIRQRKGIELSVEDLSGPKPQYAIDFVRDYRGRGTNTVIHGSSADKESDYPSVVQNYLQAIFEGGVHGEKRRKWFERCRDEAQHSDIASESGVAAAPDLPHGFVSQDKWGEIYRKIPLEGFWNGIRRWVIAVFVVPWVETRTYFYKPTLEHLKKIEKTLQPAMWRQTLDLHIRLGLIPDITSLAKTFVLKHFEGPGLFFGKSNRPTRMSWDDEASYNLRISMLKTAAFYLSPFRQIFECVREGGSLRVAKWRLSGAFLKSFFGHVLHNAIAFLNPHLPLQFISSHGLPAAAPDRASIIGLATNPDSFRSRMPAFIRQLAEREPISTDSDQADQAIGAMHRAARDFLDKGPSALLLCIYGVYASVHGLLIESRGGLVSEKYPKPLEELTNTEAQAWQTYLRTHALSEEEVIGALGRLLHLLEPPYRRHVSEESLNYLYSEFIRARYAVAITLLPNMTDHEAKSLFGQDMTADKIRQFAAASTAKPAASPTRQQFTDNEVQVVLGTTFQTLEKRRVKLSEESQLLLKAYLMGTTPLVELLSSANNQDRWPLATTAIIARLSLEDEFDYQRGQKWIRFFLEEMNMKAQGEKYWAGHWRASEIRLFQENAGNQAVRLEDATRILRKAKERCDEVQQLILIPKLRDKVEPGRLFIVTGPSATGKSTLMDHALAHVENLDRFAIFTTRPARFNEQDGRDYLFVSKEKFEHLNGQGKFLHIMDLAGYRYGVPRTLLSALVWGRDVILAGVDTIGVEHLRQIYEIGNLVAIFVEAPLAFIKEKLEGRGTPLDQLNARLQHARAELAQMDEFATHPLQFIIRNRDVSRAKAEFLEIIMMHRKAPAIRRAA